jgi:Zn-dependent protease
MRIYINPLEQKPIKIGPYTTSKREIKDLLKAWIAISLVIAYLNFLGLLDIENMSFFSKIIIAAATIGIGFLFHEIAHKIAAQRYGCFAEFRASNFMLVIAFIMALIGFPFIIFAPGAVIIAGPAGKKRNGIISFVGPATNFALAIIFFMLSFYFVEESLTKIFNFGGLVNTSIGLFNLIPLGVLDGKKILNWNKIAYYSLLAIGILLFITRPLIERIII